MARRQRMKVTIGHTSSAPTRPNSASFSQKSREAV